MSAAENPYDTILYPGHVHAQTHPDRLAVVARLMGVDAAPPGRCRVLELGCGDGTNLLAMAVVSPESEFVGFDLAELPIAKARDAVRELGLRNVAFDARSITDIPAGLGEFDYVCSHGVYSWVPHEVRDALLAATRAHLAPRGVGYVSYSSYPGAYFRRMARDMMLFHVRNVTDPRERVLQASSLARFLASAGGSPGSSQHFLAQEWSRIAEFAPSYLRHDDLGDVNDPVWFHEFAAHAARHGMRFLGEADWFETSHDGMPEPVRQRLGSIEDRVTRDQYLDFVKGRRFRQTLLVRAELEVGARPRRGLAPSFFFSSQLLSQAKETDLAKDLNEEFRTPSGAVVQTDAPTVRAALRTIGASYPHRVAFDELLARSRALLAAAGRAPADAAEEESYLGQVLERLHDSGLVRFHATRPPSVREPGKLPLASPLARWQAVRADVVSTLCGDNLRLGDEGVRRLLLSCDGRTGRDAILARLREFVESGAAPANAPTERGALDAALLKLAETGVMLG